MELLYVWINESKNGIIKQQGVNFSPEYNFIVEKQNSDWVLLEDRSWESKKSIFKNNVIENVSAIVGRNGTGKTTLLDYLSGLNCMIPHKAAYSKGYEAMQERDIREALCIYVFRENNELCIYHNFESGFDNKTGYEEKNMSNENLYREVLLEDTDFKDVFRIYITNSSFGGIQKDGISRHDKLDEVALTPKGISTIAKSYFNTLLKLNDYVHKQTLYYEWKKILKRYLEIEHFQKICDLIYLNKLIKENKIDDYAGKISTKLSVSCVFAPGLLRDNYPQTLYDEQIVIFNGIVEFVKNLRQKINNETNHVITNLVCNLVLEICLDLEIGLPKNLEHMDDCLEWAKNNLSKTSDEEYFVTAIMEIESVAGILENTYQKNNVVPMSDLAYDPSHIFDYEMNPEKYITFLNFVEECFTSKDSFVLKYIMIGNIGMSSGERAFQNYFSWINLLPQFHNIDPSIPEELRGTIMLLIDEVDLYMHPEWQKNFISLMIDEIKNQFSNYKVQIIFTTHSPLCLSDIPNENTIYLSEENGIAKIDDRRFHSQTFGKDVYSLLNDAFYLDSSTMGTFAKKYIDSIICQLYDKDNKTYKKLSFEEIRVINEKIQYIGNDILKNKLLSMLKMCFSCKEDELEILYQQQAVINRRIAELEA